MNGACSILQSHANNPWRSTVGVNIPDFTRYMSKPRDVLYQGLWFPLVCSWIAIIGIVVTSASKTIYGEYLWNPISIIDMWDGPGGRAAAFFYGVSWLLAQMCVNISATVVSGAIDMVNLWPKWINIERGTITITVVGSWAIVPWKILTSASSLLNFMSSLGIFLAPCMVSQQVSEAKAANTNNMRLRVSCILISSSSNVRSSTSLHFMILKADMLTATVRIGEPSWHS